jgi:hypothetical protein
MSQLESKPEENPRPDRRQRKKARTRRDLVEAAVRLFDDECRRCLAANLLSLLR